MLLENRNKPQFPMVPLDRVSSPFLGEARIELLPTGLANMTAAQENSDPIIMTGSVLRGIVDLTIHQSSFCDSLRLIFHASESLPLHTIGASITHRKYQQFFGTQKVLVSSQELEPGSHQLPFAFQLPQVQYPPSMEHKTSRYSCRFKLTLYAGASEVVASKEVVYRPLVETRLLYTPLIKSFRVAKRSYSAKIHALDYLPGDTIFLRLMPHDSKNEGRNSSGAADNCGGGSTIADVLLLQVVEIITLLNQHDVKLQPLVNVVASSASIKPSITCASCLYNNNDEEGFTGALSISLPSSLPPSVSYGRIITVSYRLRLVLPSHKRSLWSAINRDEKILFDLPITIGTAGYDTHNSMQQLQVYTTFSNIFASSPDSEPSPSSSSFPSLPVMPVPHSLPTMTPNPENRISGGDNDDGEDALPQYSSLRLPAYDETILHRSSNH
ncbi:hypothetical protein BDB00DRAFT_844522 [Zychaea mexicana]|uniref:uncharacterized protein n=1 Tax=Zychaea mexicana TaxID=64656 RepID=UPI0022FF2407|nr:uncharacterized protein BDB00DRAFT_844522 [Zychaea mexicana]KAI9489254.1 hypothetical protein BDB00DRAFT_844522 [Zychaea mexicana]